MLRYIFFVYLFSLFPVLGEEKLLHYFEKITLNKEFWAEGADVGDINNDGAMDVVSGPYWYEGPEYTKRHKIYSDSKSSTIKWSKTSTELIRGFAGGLGNRNEYADNFICYRFLKQCTFINTFLLNEFENKIIVHCRMDKTVALLRLRC